MYRCVANVSPVPSTDMHPARRAMGAVAGVIACAVAAFMAVALFGPAMAESADADAEKFVQELADQGLAILADGSAPLDQKKKAFGDLVVNNANVKEIGYFTLGQYRRTATPEQLAEFTDLYKQYTRNFYESRLGGFNGESMDVTGSLVRSDMDVIVTSQFVMDADSNIPVNWRLEKSAGNYIIRDLEIAGIWLALEQRSQFTSVIANNGGQFEALLVKMRDMVGKGESFDVDTTQTN